MRVFGIAGWSGSGKTTLIVKLLPVLIGRGIKVSTLKHAHHAFDLDQPGKDSFAHRQAGASEVMIGSAARWALMHELRDEREPDLAELIARMSPVDLVLVEGFKRGGQPKLEVRRQALGKALLAPDDPMTVALVTDAPPRGLNMPCFGLDDIEPIANFILAYCGLDRREPDRGAARG